MSEPLTIEKKDLDEINGGIVELRKKMAAFEDGLLSKTELEEYKSKIVKEHLEPIVTRLDDMETRMNRIKRADDHEPGEKSEERKAFAAFLRKDIHGLGPDERKYMATDDLTTGGYAVIAELSSEIMRDVVELSDMRAIADVETVGIGGLDIMKEEGSFTNGGWVGERATRTATDNATLGMTHIEPKEMYAMPKTTQRQLDNPTWNVENWFRERVAESFAVTEGSAFLTGNGVEKPEGLLVATGVTEVNSGTADDIQDADKFWEMVFTPKEFYARNARWLTRRATLLKVILLKDGMGRWLWQPDFQKGTPGVLCGYPITTMPDMPAVAANAYPFAFGDFRRAYKIVDSPVMGVIRDNVTEKGWVLFYTIKRTNGMVKVAEAFCKMKCSA